MVPTLIITNACIGYFNREPAHSIVLSQLNILKAERRYELRMACLILYRDQSF